MARTTYQSSWMNEELQLFRKTVRQFIQDQFVPHQARWREQHRPDDEAWTAIGEAGILLPDVPEEYGGGGGTFAHETVVNEELAKAGVNFGSGVQSIVGHYILAFGTEEQKRNWLPRMCRGELVGAIAMTEPGAGSDLAGIKTAARREGDEYVINGAKTFITNGRVASLVCVAVKTNPAAAGFHGMSLIVVEPKLVSGYSEGKGFSQMVQQLPYERLSIGVGAVAMAEQAVAITGRYVKDRIAFGKPLLDFQNTRFKLAECRTEVQIGRVFLDHCIERFIAGQLDAVTAAMAKYWLTECQCRVVDTCVQLHGGYGYMAEYPIAQMWTDSRVQRIYGGTNEIMKEMIGYSV